MRLLRLSTALFVSVMLLSVATIPSVTSQSATTLTSLLTTTGIWTSSTTSIAVVGTTTFTATSGFTIVSATNTLTVYGRGYCSWISWNFTINPGTSEVTGIIGPSSTSESFYILNPQQYVDFQSASSQQCGGYEGGEFDVVNLVSPYSLDWMNPQPGLYYATFYQYGGTVNFITTPFSLIATSAQVQTSTIVSVAAMQVTGPTTETLTSVQASQIPTSSTTSSPPASFSGLSPELIGGVIVVVLVAIAALILAKSRTKRQGKAKTVPAPADKFCLNCGKPLPAGTKFCKFCGTKQE